jgi:hypothetical protein
MSEKVRYYLEQSFAELDDLFTQGLFTKVSIFFFLSCFCSYQMCSTDS